MGFNSGFKGLKVIKKATFFGYVKQLSWVWRRTSYSCNHAFDNKTWREISSWQNVCRTHIWGKIFSV